MVARSPPKLQRRTSATPLPLNPILLRETINKVDRCMARLQELQNTVTGGAKVVSGVNLSPRSTRGYLKTSLRCKQESFRMRNANSRLSPGKLPTNTEDWKRMSLPAMLLGETIGEIVQTSQFARNIVEAVTKKPVATDDPKTPLTDRKKQKQQNVGNSELISRRKREKQPLLQNQNVRSESDVPSHRRAKSKINFKISPVRQRECDKENSKYIANRVSPRNKPWARKTVLFPNPVFQSSSPTSQHQKFCRTKSPVIARNQKTPHKFLIKSPTPTKSPVIERKQKTPHKFLIKSPAPPQSSKFQVKIRSPPLSISPTRASKKASSPKGCSTAAKLRRSFSPSRLANKLVSPLKSRKSATQKTEGMMRMMSGLKQRPASTSSTTIRFSPRRI